MASQGYYDWIAAGKPYTLTPWLNALMKPIRAHGLVVYHYPNEAHQEATKPLDHTPYSASGWPIAHVRWYGNALDIMPRNDTLAARQEQDAMARQLIIDKRAGLLPGLKYLNFTEVNGKCWHVSFQPNEQWTVSTDKNHIHISGRSDYITRGLAGMAPEYNLIERMEGTPPEMTDFGPNDTNAWHQATRVDAMRNMEEETLLGEPVALVSAIMEIQSNVNALLSRPPVEATPVDAETLKAALMDPEVSALLRTLAQEGSEAASDSA